MWQGLHAFALSMTYPPILSLVVLACAVGTGAFLGRRRLTIGLAAVALAWSLVWSLPPVSNWVRMTLEQRNPAVPASSLPVADAIVVLGGGSYAWARRAEVDPDDLVNSRLGAGARAWLAGRAPILILSGGGRPGHSEAQRMAMAVTRLGIPQRAIVLEQRSRNTRENATYTFDLARARGFHRVLLVTSALHMPRASLLFRETGLDVVPVSVPEPTPSRDGIRYWLPSGRALWRSGRALKEYAALLESLVEFGGTGEGAGRAVSRTASGRSNVDGKLDGPRISHRERPVGT